MLDHYGRPDDGPLPFRRAGPRSKPLLTGHGGCDLHFNVSRSPGLQVVAVALTSVGVDVERIRRLDHLERAAPWFLTEPEARALLAVPRGKDLAIELTRRWTVKEAVAKATGLGIDLHLNRIRFDPGASIATDPARGRWRVLHLATGDSHVGALAMPEIGHGVAVEQFAFSTEGHVSLRDEPKSPNTADGRSPARTCEPMRSNP